MADARQQRSDGRETGDKICGIQKRKGDWGMKGRGVGELVREKVYCRRGREQKGGEGYTNWGKGNLEVEGKRKTEDKAREEEHRWLVGRWTRGGDKGK